MTPDEPLSQVRASTIFKSAKGRAWYRHLDEWSKMDFEEGKKEGEEVNRPSGGMFSGNDKYGKENLEAFKRAQDKRRGIQVKEDDVKKFKSSGLRDRPNFPTYNQFIRMKGKKEEKKGCGGVDIDQIKKKLTRAKFAQARAYDSTADTYKKKVTKGLKENVEKPVLRAKVTQGLHEKFGYVADDASWKLPTKRGGKPQSASFQAKRRLKEMGMNKEQVTEILKGVISKASASDLVKRRLKAKKTGGRLFKLKGAIRFQHGKKTGPEAARKRTESWKKQRDDRVAREKIAEVRGHIKDVRAKVEKDPDRKKIVAKKPAKPPVKERTWEEEHFSRAGEDKPTFGKNVKPSKEWMDAMNKGHDIFKGVLDKVKGE